MTNYHFYSCGCSDTEKGGIYYCEETSDGYIRSISFTPLHGANYHCFSPDGNIMYYTVSGNAEENGGNRRIFQIF